MTNNELIIPIINQYPYQRGEESNRPNNKIKTKKTLEYGIQPRFVMKQKIRMLKNLGFQNLIGLQSTNQQENKLNLIFQYIPFRFQNHIHTLSTEIIQKIKQNMYQLVNNLAKHSIQHQLKIENIGFDKKNNLKYFLGFDFKIDRTMNKQDTLQKYKRIVQFFFTSGGPLIKRKSPNKSTNNQYYETVDTDCKLSYSEQSNHHLIPISNLMKKSSTVPIPQNIVKGQINPLSKQIFTRYTFDCNNQLIIPEQERKNYDQQKNIETKAFKIEELGARINRVKTYMKQLTGKTPTSTSGLAKFTVKIDANNLDNKIFQENKIMITPSYTKLQKKISEFRQSKLYRAYNQKQILYSKDNQGYQVHTTQKIQDNTRFTSLQPKTVECRSAQTEPTHKPSIKQQERHVPSYLLRRKQTENNSNKQSPIHSPKVQSLQSNIPSTPHFEDKKSPFDSIKTNNLNSSKNMSLQVDPQQKQYRMLAAKDKYCQQFMLFLQGEDQLQNNFISNQIQSLNIRQASESSKPQPNNQQIQQRVKKAIRNSIKLISNLKSKDSQ